MTGISEILVLVLLIICILILPRMFKGEPQKKISSSKKKKKLTVKLRLSILFTLLYPLSMALYLKPWKDHLISYLSYGVLPVFLFWAIIWVMAGKKK